MLQQDAAWCCGLRALWKCGKPLFLTNGFADSQKTSVSQELEDFVSRKLSFRLPLIHVRVDLLIDELQTHWNTFTIKYFLYFLFSLYYCCVNIVILNAEWREPESNSMFVSSITARLRSFWNITQGSASWGKSLHLSVYICVPQTDYIYNTEWTQWIYFLRTHEQPSFDSRGWNESNRQRGSRGPI